MRSAMTAPSSSVTRSTKPRSTVPSLRAGVPTETRTRSASRAEAARSDETRSRLDSRPSATSSSSPGSTIGLTPRSSGSSLCGSTSTPTTVCPSFERHAAVTAPTYPKPTTTTFIREVVSPVAGHPPTLVGEGSVPETSHLRDVCLDEPGAGKCSASRALDQEVTAVRAIVTMVLRRALLLDDALAHIGAVGYDQQSVGSRSAVAEVPGPYEFLGGVEIDIAAYTEVLRRHRRIVAIGIALTFALAVLSYVRISAFGALLPVARDLVESGDARVDAGGGAGTEVRAPRTVKEGSVRLADTGRFAGLIDVYVTLATSDAVVNELKRRGLVTAKDLEDGSLPIAADAVQSTVNAATPMMTITGNALRPKGDQADVGGHASISRRCPRAAGRGEDPRGGPHPGSRRQERRSTGAHQSEKQGIADPRASRRVDRDGGGRFHARQLFSPRKGSRVDEGRPPTTSPKRPTRRSVPPIRDDAAAGASP